MDTLPEETLQEIMECLRHSDLQCFRLVCKKFYKASLTFRIVNRENFVYGVKNILLSLSLSPKHNFDDFMKISITERRFYHFHFVNTEITTAFREFVEKRCEDILSLKFEECKIMYHPISFCESINKCIKLISLELHDVSWPVCNHAATILLPALETMDISHIPNDMFNVLMDTNVKNLHVSVDWHHLCVIRAKGRFKDLKCVDLSGDCNDARLMKIADNLNLTTIRIDCCDVTNQGFKYFIEKQRVLQIVAMRNCVSITDESLVTIAANLKDLKELTIDASDSIEYSYDAINQVLNSTPVRRLDCRVQIDYSGLATIVGDVTVSKCLRQLSMHYVQNETHVTYIAENFLSLTELKLTSSNGVTNQTLRLICQNMKNLKKLCLSFCNAINGFENDVSQLTFSANFNNLEELDLSWNNGWLSDSTLETCFKLSSLRILNLEHCEGITYKSFVAMPKNFPCLEDLNMNGIQIDCDMLLSTVSLMKRLRKLYIWVMEPITERLLNLLYEDSDSLHRVNLFKGTFIRSWERKTFIDITERVLDFDITLDEYEDEYE